MTIANVAKTIILNASGHVLLLRRTLNDLQRPGEWDFPGGGMEEGESPILAAMREASEESGIVLHEDSMRLVYATTMLSKSKKESVNRFIFAAKVPDDQMITLSHEHHEYVWLSIEDALREFSHPVYSVALRYAADNGLLGS
jgi:dihydroneopterin triphosphate diphosphatase